MADQLIYVQNDETLDIEHEVLSQNKVWHLTNSSEQTNQVYPLTGSLQSVFIDSASHPSQLLHSSGHTISDIPGYKVLSGLISQFQPSSYNREMK